MTTEALSRGVAPLPPFNNPDNKRSSKSPAFLHSPPDSNNAPQSDASDSELSDLDDEEPVLPDALESSPLAGKEQPPAPSEPNIDEDPKPEPDTRDEDIGEVLPDHWSGAVAVFKPTMHQFKDFNRFMEKVNSYGMKSGIIKIIPPPEWKDKQPSLDDLVKHVRVREPIKQEIMGSNGTYRQVNILHGRSYNVPQWRSLCNQSEHQPPARRGERRANAERAKPQRRAAAPKPAEAKPTTPKKRGRKPARGRGRRKADDEDRPMTPVSPKPEDNTDEVVDSVEQDPGADVDPEEAPTAPRRMGRVKQEDKSKTQSVSSRRKYARREGSAMIDEKAFKDFDYKMDISEFTPERCEELERAYWKTLTYAPPLYGADMMGTLFDDRTDIWNLNKLPNLLDVLGTKIPGVNTAYLYFGMWKATFAWHLEDVDLYSINYVHFGAPKQWYSISQADARRFEAAMKSIWPADAKACNQFLRHKGFLISPQHLLQNFGIKVNKVVSYPGEFVVTYPYGYHSGYNLGYNCAEAVNFALEPWLEMGKIAKRCECAQAQDSVWINVHEIERKLRGEETEFEETDEEDEDDDDEDEDDDTGLPTPPTNGVKFKAGVKRKRGPNKGSKVKVKRIKLRLKAKIDPPCCLCPNDVACMELLPTDDGRKAHRICALYLPETYIDTVDDKEIVSNISGIHKDRADLKCLFCRSKRGACFQCSQKKCARAYHATCAAAAGVFVEDEEVPVFGEDQTTEYKEQVFEFSCRYHRTKRDKKTDADALENDTRIRNEAKTAKKGDICQFQYLKGEIFAGVVEENRVDEQTLLVEVLPNGDRLEIEWKWLLLADPSDYHLTKASANAIPLPVSRKAKDLLNAKRPEGEKPRKGDPFVDNCTWTEFNLHEVEYNKNQVKIDFAKPDQIWHYLGKTSTEAKAQYTDDPRKLVHNPKGNYLDTIPKPPKPTKVAASAIKRQYYPHAAAPTAAGTFAYQYSGMGVDHQNQALNRPDKPYVYKPRKPVESTFDQSRMCTAQRFAPLASASPSPGPQGYAQGYPATPQSHTQQLQNGQRPQTYVQGYNPQQGYNQRQQGYTQPQQGHNQQKQGYNQQQQPAELHARHQNAPAYSHQRFEVVPPQQDQYQVQQYPASGWHQPAPVQHHQPVPLQHEPVPIQHQSLPVNHQPAPVQHQPASIQPTQQQQMQNPPKSPAPSPAPSPASTDRQSQKLSWQIHSSIYQKYPFYQVHHNRDSSKYRTPYAPWGGFTNGYQGDLRAHLMSNEKDLLRRTSLSSMSPAPQAAASSPYSSVYSRPPETVTPLSANQHKTSTSPAPEPSPQQLHPAIRPQFGPGSQQVSTHNQPAPPVPTKIKPPSAPSTTKLVPVKGKGKRGAKTTKHVTPVPLPANFLAAIGESAPTSPSPAVEEVQRDVTPVTNLPTKISTTPVPVPKFPGMPARPSAESQSDSAATLIALSRNGESSTQDNGAMKWKIISPGAHKTLSPTECSAQNVPAPAAQQTEPQEFPDVPGSESMEFMEKMMANLRRVVQREEGAGVV